MRSGHVAVGGRPNVGKSTLFNALLERRLSIVTRRRNTTRYCIRGIITTDDCQLTLVDTPGWQNRHQDSLNRVLHNITQQTLPHVDIGLLVVAANGCQDDDRRIVDMFPATIPVLVVINKSDLVKGQELLLPIAEQLNTWREFVAIMPVSALTGQGISALKHKLFELLPEADHSYPATMVSDRNDAFFIADFVREQIFHQLGAELPYAAAVEVLAIDRSMPKGIVHIIADIIVDTKSRQAMFVGKGGQTLKRIGSAARLVIEDYLGAKVYLKLHVKVRRNWSQEPALLARLGFNSMST